MPRPVCTSQRQARVLKCIQTWVLPFSFPLRTDSVHYYLPRPPLHHLSHSFPHPFALLPLPYSSLRRPLYLYSNPLILPSLSSLPYINPLIPFPPLCLLTPLSPFPLSFSCSHFLLSFTSTLQVPSQHEPTHYRATIGPALLGSPYLCSSILTLFSCPLEPAPRRSFPPDLSQSLFFPTSLRLPSFPPYSYPLLLCRTCSPMFLPSIPTLFLPLKTCSSLLLPLGASQSSQKQSIRPANASSLSPCSQPPKRGLSLKSTSPSRLGGPQGRICTHRGEIPCFWGRLEGQTTAAWISKVLQQVCNDPARSGKTTRDDQRGPSAR